MRAHKNRTFSQASPAELEFGMECVRHSSSLTKAVCSEISGRTQTTTWHISPNEWRLANMRPPGRFELALEERDMIDLTSDLIHCSALGDCGGSCRNKAMQMESN